LTILFISPLMAGESTKEEPVQHLIVPDVTSLAEAKQIFIDKTAEIQSKKNFDASELHELHILTYTLEKSVAYFVETTEKEALELAKEIAVVVEDIHINSENNRKEKTQQFVTQYLELAKKFSAWF